MSTNIHYTIDATIDVFTAYIKSDTSHPLETVETELSAGTILFQVDALTRELARVVIYDFSVFRRKLLMRLIFLYTTNTLENWLNTIISAFQAGHRSFHVPA
jgi:hypothetical protein